MLLTQCSPTRKLQPNEYLVTKTEINHFRETGLPKENFEAFYKQRPNRKLFNVFDFYIWWYELFDDEKIKTKKEKRNLKYDRKNAEKVKAYELKNEKRKAEGKKPKVPKLKNKDSQTLMESIRDIGEAPVLLDSSLTRQTKLQLSRYLFSKGYFNNTVTDTVVLSKNKKRASVQYNLYPRYYYTVNSVHYKIEDELLEPLIYTDTIRSKLKVGAQYDLEKIQEERKHISDFLLNKGYYYFESAYIEFDVDSNFSNRSVAITVKLKKFMKAPSSDKDSVQFTNHTRFSIQNIYIIPEQVVGNAIAAKFRDTLYTGMPGTRFLINRELGFKQFMILENIELRKGHYFSKDTAELTYKELLALGIFRNVTIQFFQNTEQADKLDCYIICVPVFRQAFTAETEGTNTSGNFGINGSLLYQNRNLFRGGEMFELKVQGALLAQASLNPIDSIPANQNKNPNRIFNTFQFGPEITYSIPRANFPFTALPFKKEMMPRTYLKTSLNMQSSVDYDRTILNISYGFNYRSNQKRLRHDIIPIDINAVKAVLTDSYEAQLKSYNDAFLLNSYQDHLTVLMRYILTWTSKESIIAGKKTAYFARLNLQSAGNILRPLFVLSGQQPDTSGSYRIGGIPFAQFLKADADFRIYVPIRAKSRIVYRMAGGIGVPQKNLSVLPYEQGFFSGGPNSVRAWRARTLGPGGYNPSDSYVRYDKIGDILLEGNFEYRFHILKSFNGAFFVDAGNIWRLKPDPAKPNGEFHWGTFLDQIAIGSGLGVRWDMNFFVLRLDFAVPLKDPKLPAGQRWTFNHSPLEYGIFNFGIGYPF
ncbi:MAG TPA: BamA/TamA family outer membrane protein [Bacteroidia bacterium]|nr:BamA/TamA family outer membrane protein [Bacteroidia bacterium]